MPDAFFANSKKRKRPQGNVRNPRKLNVHKEAKIRGLLKEPKRKRDEELSEGSQSEIADLDLRASDVDPNESDKEEYSNETPAEKRLRLAKVYLESVKEDLAVAEGEYDAAEIDKEIISSRLKEGVLEHAGKLHIHIAGTLSLIGYSHFRIKPHRFAVTAAVLSDDAKFLYTCGKEGTISCYDISSKKNISRINKSRREGKGKGKARALDSHIEGHTDEILALAISGDGKYLVSGGKDRRIGVWNIEAEGGMNQIRRLTWLRSFTGHKDTVSGLSFRKSTNILYSSSMDRTVKLFDLSPGVMGYVETLFGHQEGITDLDSLTGDTAITAAGRDRTVRFWKIAEETQLVFRGGGSSKHKMRDLLEIGFETAAEKKGVDQKQASSETWLEGSIDCVSMIDESTFVSGGDNGSISIWSTTKKKPSFSFPIAHGLEEIESSTEGTLLRPRWITSIGSLRYGDVFASGSWDGHIRLWKIHSSLRSFAPLRTLEVQGVVNSLQIALIPKDWTFDESWSKQDNQSDGINGGPDERLAVSQQDSRVITPRRHDGVLVTAAVGQEPKFGRWIKLKGDGVTNCAMVFAVRRNDHSDLSVVS